MNASTPLPEPIAQRASRAVAVLGCGVSGRGASDLLRSRGCEVEIYDEKPGEDVRGEFSPKQARKHGLVVYSPGFRQDHAWLQAARAAGCLCVGEMDFASLFWEWPVVAVTGTNGKTTLTEFIATALRRRGVAAAAAGNIGHPLSRLSLQVEVGERVAVCEVSSFQAEGLQFFKPDALLWTNFDEDHMDRYANLREYFEAKWNLVVRLKKPKLFVGESVAAAAKRFGFELPKAAAVVTMPGNEKQIPAGTVFAAGPQRENYLVARAWWLAEGYPVTEIEETARLFKTRRHRLERVAEMEGVEYWNDSKGTNFHATLAALETFSMPVVWIGGGKSKGGDIEGFAGRAAGRVREAFVIGETAGVLASGLHARGVPAVICESLREAVERAHAAARQSLPARVLFSPGFSSFDMFRDYAERGLAFEQAVLSLKAGAPAAIEETAQACRV